MVAVRLVALVRRTSPLLGSAEPDHLERVDVRLAQQQWEAYCAAFAEAGWAIQEVPPAFCHPDSVFVEDTAVGYGELAVIGRPGDRSRAGEPDLVLPVLTDHGCRIERIQAPGTLAGGDVLKHGGTVWVGVGGSTDHEGFEQFRGLLSHYCSDIRAVPLTRVPYLKSAVTALPDGTVAGHPPLVGDPSMFASFLPVPEASGAQVVLLGGRSVLMAASAPATATLFRDRGLDVRTVDISEFEKLQRGVTSMSIRLRLED